MINWLENPESLKGGVVRQKMVASILLRSSPDPKEAKVAGGAFC